MGEWTQTFKITAPYYTFCLVSITEEDMLLFFKDIFFDLEKLWFRNFPPGKFYALETCRLVLFVIVDHSAWFLFFRSLRRLGRHLRCIFQGIDRSLPVRMSVQLCLTSFHVKCLEK
jgi:hypothetical protein